MGLRVAVLAGSAACCVACSFAWDDFDPRNAQTTSGTVETGGGGTAGTGASQGAGPSAGPGGGGGAPPATGGSGGTGGTASGGGMGPIAFHDDFNRADDPAIGNGWLEKEAGVFALASNHIVKLIAGPGYLDNLVVRPASEMLLDVEASMEFEMASLVIQRPQLIARARSSTVLDPGAYDGYKVWINGAADSALISRQNRGGSSQPLDGIILSPPLVPDARYRLRIRVEGQNPVVIEGFVEAETSSGWDVIGSGSFSDASPQRIDQPGVVGFAGHTGTNYILDDFRYQAL